MGSDMKKGWVSIHRKIWEWPYAQDAEYLSVWLFLLTHAAHQPYDVIFNGSRIKLQIGQLIVGRDFISEKTKVSSSKVQRILKKLEIEQQIEQQTTNKNRLISILNWGLYQKSEQQSEQQLNNKRTTNEQQLNTNNNYNNITIKKLDKTYSSDFEEFWKQYPKKVGKPAAFKAYVKAIKNNPHSEILYGAMTYAAQEIDPRFIKHPQGWLNDERWKDIPTNQQGVSQNGTRKKSLSEQLAEQRDELFSSR